MLNKISTNVRKLAKKPLFLISGRRRTHDALTEVDPIYPDTKQPLRSPYKLPHRAPYQQSTKAILKSQSKMGKYLIKSVTRSINEQEREAQKAMKKGFHGILGEIMLDPLLKLPYGFHFDDYILKQHLLEYQSGRNELDDIIKRIYKDLKVFNEFELALLFKHAHSVSHRDEFKEKARKVVLGKFLKEIARKGIGNLEEGLERYFEKVGENREFYLAALQDLNVAVTDEICQKLQEKIIPEKIDKEAQALALDDFEKKVYDARASERQNYKPGKRQVVSYDPFFFGQELTSSEEPAFSEEMDHPKQKIHGYTYENLLMNDEDFERYQLWRDVKKNYFRNKMEFVKETVLDKKQAKFLDGTDKKATETDWIEDVAREYGLNDFYTKPDFNKIYENIDSLVLHLPITKEESTPDPDKVKPSMSLSTHPADYLWNNIKSKFETVIPKKHYDFEKSVKSLAAKADKIVKDNERHENTTRIKIFPLSRDFGTEFLKGNENTPRMLDKNEQIELEVYRHVRYSPFFQHHLTNNLKYFSERMIETSLAMKNHTVPGQPSYDYLNYINPIDKISKRQIDKYRELLEKKNKSALNPDQKNFFSGGRRKTAHAMALLLPGRGLVSVNHQPFDDYFHEQSFRSYILSPLKYTDLPCFYDLRLYVSGGGIQAQREACRMALARCIIKIIPSLKTGFKKMALIKADRRQVERKHLGHYKARKKFPYKRR